MTYLFSTIKYMLLSYLLIFTYSCQGPEGEIGPKGDQGTSGEDGNANVFSSDWFTPSGYTLNTTDCGIECLEYNQPAPEITQEIIDSGVILVYGKLNGYSSDLWPKDNISLLPIILTYVTTDEQKDTWSTLYSLENIKIRFLNSSNQYFSLSTQHSFRYVVIPSSSTSGGRISKLSKESIVSSLNDSGIDINNIEEVMEYFRN